MARNATDSENMELEDLMDKISLESMIESLVEICHGKADHLRSNWQDENAAKSWERDARKLSRISAKLEN